MLLIVAFYLSARAETKNDSTISKAWKNRYRVIEGAKQIHQAQMTKVWRSKHISSLCSRVTNFVHSISSNHSTILTWNIYDLYNRARLFSEHSIFFFSSIFKNTLNLHNQTYCLYTKLHSPSFFLNMNTTLLNLLYNASMTKEPVGLW